MSTLNRILSYTKKYWKALLISGITASLYGIFSAAPTYILKYMVDDIFINQMNNLLIPFIIGFVLLFALKGLFIYLSNYYMNWVGNKVINDIRLDLFKKIIYFPISFFKEKTTGQLMSHFLNDIQMIQQSSSSAVKNGARSFFEAIFLIGVAFTQNWKLTLMMFLVGPIIAIAIKRIGNSVKRASIHIQNDLGSISTMLQEVFIGIREVKAFNGENIETKRFSILLKSIFKSMMHNVHTQSFGPAFIETVSMTGGGIVLYVAANQIMAKTITAGQLTAFFASILLLYQPLKRLINVYAEIHYGLGAAEKIFNVMDKVYPAISRENCSKIPAEIFEIKFENVNFSYENQNNIVNVIQNANLNIKKGDRIGILGASGSGKSTFCDLMLSFITPTSGNIFINNQNISQISLKDIRNRIGYVNQKAFLFNDTIIANIAYTQKEKTLDKIIAACKAAHAHEFIQKLPKGYNTIVGENGNKLSGGQKQRLTIARALLKTPEILIFDEATSALDQESENLIHLAIEEINKEKTIIIISHRLSFIEKMDRILMIKNKNIIEINKKGLQREIAKSY